MKAFCSFNIKSHCDESVHSYVHIIFFLTQRRWIAALSSEFPTLAFHASVQNPFGKGALIQLLRQFGKVSFHHFILHFGFLYDVAID